MLRIYRHCFSHGSCKALEDAFRDMVAVSACNWVYNIDYNELFRRWLSDVRWTFKKRLRKQYESLNLNTLF